MMTKKILVPVDINNPQKKLKGFLYPKIDNNEANLLTEIKSGKTWEHGMIVFIGREISENDIFKSIVDSGVKIDSVENLIQSLKEYIKQVSTYKIGDILEAKKTKENRQFELIKIKRPTRVRSSRLP